MRSLRTKITLLTVGVVFIALAVVTVLSVVFIRRSEHKKSDQLLLLLCETGERNLDFYFDSIQASVGKVASFVEADMDGLDTEHFSAHMERAEAYFDQVANKTNGVLTYYYRVDPAVSGEVKGFWYTNLDGKGFKAHEVTDITLYDTADTSALVWFTVPKFEGRAIWLPPYITDNLDVRVLSYNIPVYWRGTFVGVVGIELDYSTMAEQVDSIRLYSNGYAFLNDDEGNLFYHPRIDVSTLTPETTPVTPVGVVGEHTFINYTFEGVEKQAAWLPLRNGMRINVTVPVSEMEGDWQWLIWNILLVAIEVMVAASVFVLFYTKRITKPLEALTEAADQVNRDDYDIDLSYNRDDELGRLTNTFRRLARHMQEHISDLSERVYVDALTHVRNKGAYADYLEALQHDLEAAGGDLEFAVGVFDCDDLKSINDQYGHDKGDIYIKSACRLICSVFQHSPVFRIGGDEFATVLRNEDYLNREALCRQFRSLRDQSSAAGTDRWSQASVTMGLAAYDPKTDRAVSDVQRRADKLMYENKRSRKATRGGAPV